MTIILDRLAGCAYALLVLVGLPSFGIAQCPDDYNFGCSQAITDESFHRQWAIEAIRACEVWELGYTGTGIVVGIVDAGILEYHPDLVGQVQPVIGGCSEARPDFSEVHRCILEDVHGTYLAGIVAGLRNNGDTGLGENMVGVAYNAELAEVFLYDDNGGNPVPVEEHVQVIEFGDPCIDVKVHAYDLAGEGSIPNWVRLPAPIRGALASATTSGRDGLGQVFVWSAGNGGADGQRTDYEELVSARFTMSVGAVSPALLRRDSSEIGSSLFCSAPGSHLVLPVRDVDLFPCPDPPYVPKYGSCGNVLGGTSFSTPHVGGVVALMMEANDNLSWRDVQNAIARTAATIDPTSGWQTNQAGIDHSYEYGHGLIDAFEAVSFVTGTNGYPAWKPLLGERQVIVPLDTGTVQVGPGGTAELPIAVTANMRLEHVELLMNVTTVSNTEKPPGIGPLEIEIERVWPPIIGGRFGQHITQSIFAVARDDPTVGYNDAIFTSVRHWRENATATWKVRLRNTSDSTNPVTATWHVAELRFYGTPKCIADWDMDGNPQQQEDWDLYTDWYDTGDLRADLNGDRVVTQADRDIFILELAMGCP